jgi:hypothetical protein
VTKFISMRRCRSVIIESSNLLIRGVKWDFWHYTDSTKSKRGGGDKIVHFSFLFSLFPMYWQVPFWELPPPSVSTTHTPSVMRVLNPPVLN